MTRLQFISIGKGACVQNGYGPVKIQNINPPLIGSYRFFLMNFLYIFFLAE